MALLPRLALAAAGARRRDWLALARGKETKGAGHALIRTRRRESRERVLAVRAL
jgi:hypothetical protein